MHMMRSLVFVTAGAVAEVAQWGHVVEPVQLGAVAPRGDGCGEVPKLCTDSVLLRGYETTLTYLCPETEVPTTVTVTTTATTTVTDSAAPTTSSESVELPESAPIVNTSTSAEPTTTKTIQSTMEITRTETVTRAIVSSSFSLTPPVITASFPAVLPSDVKLSSATVITSSSGRYVASLAFPTSESPPVATVQASSVFNTSSFDLFPTHSVASSSTTAYIPSTSTSSKVVYPVPIFVNKTSSHSGYNMPTMNLAREAKSTENVTTAAAVPTATFTGVASESSVSFVALFLSVMAAAFMF